MTEATLDGIDRWLVFLDYMIDVDKAEPLSRDEMVDLAELLSSCRTAIELAISGRLT